MKVDVRVTMPDVIGKPARRLLNEGKRNGFVAIGKLWHEKFRIKHFTMAAYGEYSYTQRRPGYVKKKRLRLHHNLPLVFSGDTRANSAIATIDATENRVKIRYGKVSALNFRPRGGRIDMRKEFSTVSAIEEQQLTRLCDETLTRALNK